ncbi:hypothetical protein M9H77_06454 [Catharanthus roseus]|uniref:Uncharacterized protein n=1 Tax=Catharanthus roseus TaxID=4058 RepID=A0ACC0BSC1_CATRO|nr:hypothetical protein M9H77_06454 [Catharanthus roseus]
MHRSGAPYSVRGLHFTWLVPRTSASSDGVDVSDSGEWIHLKRGVDHNASCFVVGFGRLVESQEGLETEVGARADLTLSMEPHCCITCSFKFGADTKELHVPCKMDTFIIVVTTERALQYLVLYSIYIKYYFTLPISECKDEGELIMMGSAR